MRGIRLIRLERSGVDMLGTGTTPLLQSIHGVQFLEPLLQGFTSRFLASRVGQVQLTLRQVVASNNDHGRRLRTARPASL